MIHERIDGGDGQLVRGGGVWHAGTRILVVGGRGRRPLPVGHVTVAVDVHGRLALHPHLLVLCLCATHRRLMCHNALSIRGQHTLLAVAVAKAAVALVGFKLNLEIMVAAASAVRRRSAVDTLLAAVFGAITSRCFHVSFDVLCCY